MTTDKARKRAVRTRMQKTGERYAAARRHVSVDRIAHAVRADTSPSPLPPRVADPGMPDESIVRGTGRSWDDWFRDLDAWGAAARTHTEIARHVHGSFDISGWWAQSVTVGYERARGMRAMHQTSRGFEVSVSKTLAAAPATVWPFIAESDLRDAWVGAGVLETRKRAGVAGKNARFDVMGDSSRVVLILTPKEDGRTVLTVTHERLSGADDVADRRIVWRERLARLAKAIERVGA